MMWLRWILTVPLYIVLWLLKFPLAPIAVMTCMYRDKDGNQWLGKPFMWLNTIDCPLNPRGVWEKLNPGKDLDSQWMCILWLWRNGFQYANYMILGVPVEKAVRLDIGSRCIGWKPNSHVSKVMAEFVLF